MSIGWTLPCPHPTPCLLLCKEQHGAGWSGTDGMQHGPWSYYSGRLNFGFIDPHCCCLYLPLHFFSSDVPTEFGTSLKNEKIMPSEFPTTHFHESKESGIDRRADWIRIIWALSWISFWAGFQSHPLCLPSRLWRGDNYTCSSFASEGCYKDSFKESIKVFWAWKSIIVRKYIVTAVVLTNMKWFQSSIYRGICIFRFHYLQIVSSHFACFFPGCVCLRGGNLENRSSATKISVK